MPIAFRSPPRRPPRVQRRWAPRSAPLSGITGALTATLGAATLSGTGALAISGALTTTLSAATLSGTGALPISGAVTSTLAAATLAGTGTLPITGSSTVTLDAATVSASGTIGSFATLAVTLNAATLAATGTLPIAGAVSVALAPATLAGVGTLPIVAGATVTLAAATLSASGVSTGGTVLFPPDRFTTSQRRPRRQRRVAFDGAFGVRMSGAQDGRKLFDLVEGTTAQLDPFRLYIEDAPINLTGITVACIVRDVNGDPVTIASGQIEVDADQSWNATTETGGRGQVYLTPTAGQFTNALSPYRIRWQLTDGAGDVQFVPDGPADRFFVFKP